MYTLEELERRLKEAEYRRKELRRKLQTERVRISRYKKAIENLNQLDLFEKEENNEETID